VLHRGFIYPVELLAPSNIKLVDPAADAGWGHFGSSCAIQSRPTPATQPLTRLSGEDVETLNLFAVVCWSDRACSVTTAPPEGSRCKHWCRRTPRAPLRARKHRSTSYRPIGHLAGRPRFLGVVFSSARRSGASRVRPESVHESPRSSNVAPCEETSWCVLTGFRLSSAVVVLGHPQRSRRRGLMRSRRRGLIHSVKQVSNDQAVRRGR
jgi:hypothetical protein